jgi:chromosome segregation ATPase
VDISLSGGSPAEVAKQVNTVAEVYVEQNMERRREASKKAVAQLKAEASHLKHQIRQAKDTLQNLKQQQQMASNSTDDGTKKLERLEDSYLKLVEKRKNLEIRIQELRGISKNTQKDDLKKSLTFLLPDVSRETYSLPTATSPSSCMRRNRVRPRRIVPYAPGFR